MVDVPAEPMMCSTRARHDRADDDEVARSRLTQAVAIDRDRNARTVRLADDEATAPSELDDDAVSSARVVTHLSQRCNP
jgi:hypothetical protein